MLNETACAWAQQPRATAMASACGLKMARIVVLVMRLPRWVPEGITLMARQRPDKRTKEVFALSLQRINRLSGTGSGACMGEMDDAP
ncbi:hypothetical protein D9M71_53850 [compost metagenome]